jgi:glycosyltransferase involved in cell wall biosynthesis
MKILFVIPYPQGTAASQRFRFEHYLPLLKARGYGCRVASFIDRPTWDILYKKGHTLKKTGGILKGFIKRFILLFAVPRYDVVFVHREATPIGPAWFEWMVAKLFRKKLIYDFDDAIWIPVVSPNNTPIKWLRNFGKVQAICRLASMVVAGNDFLADYARQYNPSVTVIPTVVDTESVHNRIKNQDEEPVRIGWTGTFSTLFYLKEIIPVLQKIQETEAVSFVVIADKDPALPLKYYQFIPWEKEKETDQLLMFHAGLMPLEDTELAKGKCGFKAIQYMALGLPALVSPVGVNTSIVDHGVNGFICNTAGDWEKYILQLINDDRLRERMGRNARDKIARSYSVNGTADRFLQLFE